MYFLYAEFGHVMSAEYNGQSSSAQARLITDYLYMDGYCLELYHWIRGSTVLQVKSRGEDHVERTLLAIVEVNDINWPSQ